MGQVTIHTVEQGSPEWLAARDGKYTGTSAAKLLKYGIIEYSKTATSTFTGNWFTRRGHELEPQCLEIYEAIKKCKVLRPGYVTNSDFLDCLFSPDGVTEDTLLECKAFNEKKHSAIYNGDIPFEIQAQIHFGMLITELKQASSSFTTPT
ncbi:MAG: YqaJ viral recombinase family protein [Ktedonobacteraceae bacterium]